jgi:outer membrane receptor protein involved in Fe transport
MEWSLRPEVHYSGKRFAMVIGGGSSRFGDLRGGDSSGFQRPSGYREGAYDIKLRMDIGAGWELTASAQWLKQRQVPVYHKYVLENFVLQDSDPISRSLSYLKMTKSFSSGVLRRIHITASSQNMEETRFSRKRSSIVTRREQDRVSTKGVSIDLAMQFTSLWKSNSGVELYADRVRSHRNDLDFFNGPINDLRGLYPDRARYMHASLYSLHHLSYKRLQIESGIRQTFYKASLSDNTLGKIIYSPKAFVLQAGMSYRLFDNVFMYAHLSEGFRAANIDDLGTLGIVDFRYEIPAYDLKPERSLNQEWGIKYQSSRFYGTFSLFRVKLFDLITRIKTAAVIAGYDVYQKVNVDKGYIRGWEAEFNYLLFPSLQVQAGTAYLYGQSITRNEPLRRIPPFNSRVSILYMKQHYSAALHIDQAGKQSRLAQGDRDDNRIPAGGTPGFTVLHVQAGVHFGRTDIRIMCHNIFNTDYRLHGSGINGMGRAISIGSVFSLH